MGTTKYENTDTSTPWPPSPAGEGGISGSGGVPPYPHLRGLASQDSPLFSLGDSIRGETPLEVRQRRSGPVVSPVERGVPQTPPKSPQEWGAGGLKELFSREEINEVSMTHVYCSSLLRLPQAGEAI